MAELPTYDQFIQPLLSVLAEHSEGIRSAQACEEVADAVGLDLEARTRLLPSGRQPIYRNRVGWAHDRLKRAGYSTSVKRGFWCLTEKGRDFASANSAGLTADEIEALARVPKDSRVQAGSDEDEATNHVVTPVQSVGPEERIEAAVTELEESVAGDLLELIMASTPLFFEHLVLDVLHGLGYGTTRSDLKQIGGVNDGGIDGIISLDKLGLEKVYVQAKRWSNTVGRPEIQGFFGALAGHRAKKGIFITTSGFSRGAREYAEQVSDSLVLVDGRRLTALMMTTGVGVSHQVIRLAKVDTDYFDEG